MSRITKLTCLFLSIVLSGVLHAKPIKVSVQMVDIQAEKTSEAEGDELYFNVTQYSNQKSAVNMRVPSFPSHWLSSHLPQLKNVVLWEGVIEEQESIKLVFALLEQDLPLLTQMMPLVEHKLELHQSKGRLKSHWVIPVYEEKQEVEMLKPANPQRFIFKGDGSKYRIAFLVSEIHDK